MRPTIPLAVTLLVASSVSGCRWHKSRTDCPTDARGLMLSCAGEEAVRRCPCGPDVAYYGHRPTTWSVWPAGWDEYASARCEICEADCEDECDGEGVEPIVADSTVTPLLSSDSEGHVAETPVESSVVLPPSTPLNLPPLEPKSRAEEASEPVLIEPEESVPTPPSTPLELPSPSAGRSASFDHLLRDPLEAGPEPPDSRYGRYEEPAGEEEAIAEPVVEDEEPASPYLGLFTP